MNTVNNLVNQTSNISLRLNTNHYTSVKTAELRKSDSDDINRSLLWLRSRQSYVRNNPACAL